MAASFVIGCNLVVCNMSVLPLGKTLVGLDFNPKWEIYWHHNHLQIFQKVGESLDHIVQIDYMGLSPYAMARFLALYWNISISKIASVSKTTLALYTQEFPVEEIKSENPTNLLRKLLSKYGLEQLVVLSQNNNEVIVDIYSELSGYKVLKYPWPRNVEINANLDAESMLKIFTPIVLSSIYGHVENLRTGWVLSGNFANIPTSLSWEFIEKLFNDDVMLHLPAINFYYIDVYSMFNLASHLHLYTWELNLSKLIKRIPLTIFNGKQTKLGKDLSIGKKKLAVIENTAYKISEAGEINNVKNYFTPKGFFLMPNPEKVNWVIRETILDKLQIPDLDKKILYLKDLVSLTAPALEDPDTGANVAEDLTVNKDVRAVLLLPHSSKEKLQGSSKELPTNTSLKVVDSQQVAANEVLWQEKTGFMSKVFNSNGAKGVIVSPLAGQVTLALPWVVVSGKKKERQESVDLQEESYLPVQELFASTGVFEYNYIPTFVDAKEQAKNNLGTFVAVDQQLTASQLLELFNKGITNLLLPSLQFEGKEKLDLNLLLETKSINLLLWSEAALTFPSVLRNKLLRHEGLVKIYAEEALLGFVRSKQQVKFALKSKPADLFSASIEAQKGRIVRIVSTEKLGQEYLVMQVNEDKILLQDKRAGKLFPVHRNNVRVVQ